MLRMFRERASLTQTELGRRARLSPKAIGALERGERLRPQPPTVRALALALELTEEDRKALLACLERGMAPDAGGPTPVTLGPTPEDAGLVEASQRAAAWKLYVELVTRIAVVELPSDKGLLRDALSSLHSLFPTTRRILSEHGPAVFHPRGDGEVDVGTVALAIVNSVVRPVLQEWHPALKDHEDRRPAGVSSAEHERAWERNEELREVLSCLRVSLQPHARRLAAAAGLRNPP